MIKAILFDMDGLLFDSEELHYLSLSDAFKKLGFGLTREDFIEEYFVKSKVSEDILKERGLEDRAEEFTGNRWSIFRKLVDSDLKPMPYALEFLSIARKNFKIAVVTNTPRSPAMHMLDKFGLAEKFDAVVCREDYDKRKPNPESYLTAAKRLGVSPEECLVIEDSRKGLLSAKNAGMKCFIVKNEVNQTSDFKEADFIFSSLKEIDLKTIREMS